MATLRFSGWFGLLILALIVVFLIAAAVVAVKLIIWLLPLIIVAVAAWALLYIFNRPPKKSPLDVAFRVKE